MEEQGPHITRRRFLQLGRSTLVIAGLSLIYPIGRYLTFPTRSSDGVSISTTEADVGIEWRRVRNTRYWLRKKAGRLEALWATCTHLGCEVHFDTSSSEWVCPCHGSRYDREGIPISGPALNPLLKWNVGESKGLFMLRHP